MASNAEKLDDVEKNPYASASRWRHQESPAFLRHAGQAVPRHAQETHGNTSDLASFLNKDRVEPERPTTAEHRAGNFKPIMIGAAEAKEEIEPRQDAHVDGVENAGVSDGREVVCGPLLNYRRTEGTLWRGSALIVVSGGGKTQNFVPTMNLRRELASDGRQYHETPATNGTNGVGTTDGAHALEGYVSYSDSTQVKGECLYSDPRNTFWAFDVHVEMDHEEGKWEYWFDDVRFTSQTKPQRNHFWVPATNESMRMMFHSCNGFSVGTDEEAYSGLALWNDVTRRHREKPFHVMIGGGDQIYNDGIRVSGPLRAWTDISNPTKRRHYPFPEKLRQACDDYYLKNYIKWYSREPFAGMNGTIPQVNIWDDHDIIDGFGSYVDEFMKCDVFRGIGGTAHKYYMLFQHHLPPPPSTYTTDHGESLSGPGQGEDPNQLMDTFVAPSKTDDCYIVGSKHGPYVAEHSHNIFCKLGARVAMVGIDARTERTRHQINYPETYDQIFERTRQELQAAADAGQPFKHLILLLGIPIAYPRLTWLETVFRSPLMGPVRLLNKRFGVAGGLFNQFDGSIDLLDDLDDHYTARTHKRERQALVERLQKIAAEFSVRITILGGDVHLAALGRFYSHPKLGIATDNDHRYMANVVSSAIVNKPPPTAVANLLAKRNKIHHLNHDTDETLLTFFNKNPGDSNKTPGFNKVTMPSRNFAILTENSPNNPAVNAEPENDGTNGTTNGSVRTNFSGKGGHDFLHPGEVDAGTLHRAASAAHGRLNDGSLDIVIRVEIDQHDKEGKTDGYGLTVPLLHYTRPVTPAAPFPQQEHSAETSSRSRPRSH
ncbi:hypothetical protein HYQ45_016773 [Verticillium longisporum]|uniref:PhoD-like phosphatase domain-containing protein n=3 Tax=Verticillium TaxID=1036719 RepID=G2WYX7_VERDV|nr:uncharacterized protein VDAG_03219 [Verticillium dahliae VdLs.17]KAF3344821.1 Translationally-controlled tumor protein-like protein [Verticillium dahliae VDG2]KAG7113514.1 hypothetical protein HYQ45_016773 [Verticillium longisporum]KAH6703614.1 hypothetical protein EV126DRAFT_359949 [Verticillium dahliae]EGY21779.1 hypothetical protein VDAG_03219 [Verticillium dahliae VdLs.17]PNH28232.1 hypothetical protein BJF96_g8453 [Verticillium dahliae]